MLSPDYLIYASDDVANIYSDLHTATLNDITRRIVKSVQRFGTTEATATTAYQFERLRYSGLSQEEIERRLSEMFVYDLETNRNINDLNAETLKRIRATLTLSREKVRELFEDMAVKNYRTESTIYNQAEISPPPIDNYIRIVNSNIQRVNTDLRNMTGTFAINAEQRFKNILSTAYGKTASGAFSYTEAVNSAVDELVREGIKTRTGGGEKDYVFAYASGREISLEAAVLMNVRTSVNQTAAEMTKQMMIDTGTSYVQVSAHLNARNKGEGHINHESWQGGVYYWKEIATEPNVDPSKYKDFVTTCGYGLVDGIHGPNCRHGEGAFIPGMTNIIHSKKELEEMAKTRYIFVDPITNEKYNLDPYAASQMQRDMEREERNHKRKSEIYSAAGNVTPRITVKSRKANAKIEEWQYRLREFTEQTGLKRQYFREKIA